MLSERLTSYSPMALNQVLVLIMTLAGTRARIQSNMTTVDCPGVTISASTRANCTITTRDASGKPIAGAELADFAIFHADELLDPSPVQGGPIHFFVEFATCMAGYHNVTVQHLGEYNVTAQAHVIPGIGAGNFTLDCERGHREYVAGNRVRCAIATLDSCGNPTAMPPASAARWSVVRTGFALDDGDTVLPVYLDDDQAAADAATLLVTNGAHLFGGGGVGLQTNGGGGLHLLTSRYETTFRTGRYWTPLLNYTERGIAGLEVSYASANFSETRSSAVFVRAAALAAAHTRVRCLPTGGLLEGHVATCLVSTYDKFDNPQIGASPTDFAVRFLSNPAAQLGTDAGPLSTTNREVPPPPPRPPHTLLQRPPPVPQDTFMISFQAIDIGTAGVTISITFPIAAGTAGPNTVRLLQGCFFLTQSPRVDGETSLSSRAGLYRRHDLGQEVTTSTLPGLCGDARTYHPHCRPGRLRRCSSVHAGALREGRATDLRPSWRMYRRPDIDARLPGRDIFVGGRCRGHI